MVSFSARRCIRGPFTKTLLTLFSQDLIRTALDPARYAEPHFAYLDRSARPEAHKIRELLEAWFERYPEGGRADLTARFRSPDEVHHYSAFFELYLHELLRLLGYAVEVHPALPGTDRQPDFRASRQGDISFYLEAIVATDRSDNERAADARLNDVYDALNKVRSPDFFINASVTGSPSSQVPGRRLRSEVERFLGTLDPDDVKRLFDSGGFDSVPKARFEHDGWTVEYSPLPKSREARGDLTIRPLGMHGPGSARWVDDSVALRDAVIKKATRYGDLEAPYIIAVNAVNQHLDQEDIMDALFGKETHSIPVGPHGQFGEAVRGRRLDGAWTSASGPINRRVSAVLVGSSIIPWSVGAYSPAMFHNPWAHVPCTDALRELHALLPVGDEMQARLGRCFSELVGLPDGWPRVDTSDEG